MRSRLAVVGMLAGAAVATAGCGDTARTTSSTTTTKRATPRVVAPQRPRRVVPSPAQVALGLPPVSRGPVPGYVLIADRNNNRLLIVSPSREDRLAVSEAGRLGPAQSFRDPDDAFFAPGYKRPRPRTRSSTRHHLAQIDLRRKRIVWSYGRPGVAGSATGGAVQPGRRVQLPNGPVQVADIQELPRSPDQATGARSRFGSARAACTTPRARYPLAERRHPASRTAGRS